MIRLSPLRYPGGKSKYIKFLEPVIPLDFNNFIEPFCGGASVTLYYAKKFPDRKFWMNDIDYKLYCFWSQLKNNNKNLTKKLYYLAYPLDLKNIKQGEKLYQHAKKMIESKDELEIASAYFILNRIVFGGMTEKTSFSKTAYMRDHFTTKKANELKSFEQILKNIKITNLSYESIFNNLPDDSFLFLDPPYDIKDTLYGKDGILHKNFDHEKFKNNCDNIKDKCKFLITYNDSVNIRENFKQYNIITREYTYSMVYKKLENGDLKSKLKNETMIMNYKGENNEICE